MTNFQKAAAELAGALVRKTRDDGTTYYTIKDDAPAWISGVDFMHTVHAAVDGPSPRFPNDWIYMAASEVADALHSYDHEDADAAREDEHQICDGLVDVYSSNRMQWLASHLGNAALCDEACAELGADEDADMFTRIGLGQYLAYSRIFGALVQACEGRAADLDERREGWDELINGLKEGKS